MLIEHVQSPGFDAQNHVIQASPANLSTWEVEAGEPGVQGYPPGYTEFEISLFKWDPVSKKKIKNVSESKKF